MEEKLAASGSPWWPWAVAVGVLILAGVLLLALRVRRRLREGREEFDRMRREARAMATDPEESLGPIEPSPE